MSRKAILSTLAGAVVLAIGAVSAQAAPMPKAPAGSVLNKGGVVEQAHYRHHRHYRHHHHRHHYYRHHHHRHYWR